MRAIRYFTIIAVLAPAAALNGADAGGPQSPAVKFVARTDGSSENILFKLDGGIDLATG